jgi:hypothetical protein
MDRSKVIRFLVERKFPIVRAVMASGSRVAITLHADREDIRNQAAAFAAELAEMPPAELSQLHATELEAERQERVRAAVEEERRRFFHSASATANFEYWCKAAYWTLDEAIALVLGKEPSVVTPAAMKPFRHVSPFVANFERLRNLAARAVWAGSLFDPVFPSIFANWAVDTEIPLPDEILKRVLNGKPARTVLESMVGQQGEMIEVLKQTMALKDERLSGLAARVSELETLVGQNPNHIDDPTPQKPQPAVQRDNMLKVIWAVAVDAYGHGPYLKRSKAVSDIRSALELRGLDPPDDTIRRYLAAARDRLRDWQDEGR